MNEKEQYLLACLAEECNEVAQVCMKSLRFGLDDFHPKHGNMPNVDLIYNEMIDLITVYEMLFKEINKPYNIDVGLKLQKENKVEKYWKYANEKRNSVFEY